MFRRILPALAAVTVSFGAEPVLWNDGTWDASGAPIGKLLSDNPGWWGERLYTGVTYSYANTPTLPADVQKNDPTKPGRRLLDGNPAYHRPVGISGKPLVVAFDFKRPCSFTEVTLLSPANGAGRGILEASDDGTNWTRVCGFQFKGPRSRIIPKLPSAGSHLRISMRARGRVTQLDEVLVWGNGEVSARHPEAFTPLCVEGVNAFTDRRNGGLEIWVLPELKFSVRSKGSPVPRVVDARCVAVGGSLKLAMARNETETRYLAVVNASDAPMEVPVSLAGFDKDIGAELRIGGVMRVDGGRLRDDEGDAVIYAPYPFFMAGEKPPANVMAKYFANATQVKGFPAAVPLGPGEGATLMVRFTTRGAAPGMRRGLMRAGTTSLPITLSVRNVILPSLPLWVHFYSPFTTQFPFESRTRVERDVEMLAALGASTCYGMPHPGTKQELLRRYAPHTIFTPRRWMDLKLLNALRNGKASLDDPASCQKIADCVMAAEREARECGLDMEDWCLFLLDEPGRKTAALYGEIGRRAKAALPGVQIYMNPCFWERDPTVSDDPFRPSPNVIYEYLKPFYNEVVDISCPARGMVIEGSRLVEELLKAKRKVNALYIHPPVPVGRTLAWTAFRNGFNGYAYYCYYSPRGNPYDISEWKSLSRAYLAVVPLAEGVGITPVYEVMREANEDYRLLCAVRDAGHTELLAELMEASAGTGDCAGMVPPSLDCQTLRDKALLEF